MLVIGVLLLATLPQSNQTVAPQPTANDVAVAMAVAPSGNVFITGYSRVAGSTYDFETAMYNSEGVLQWRQLFDGPSHGDDRPAAIAIDANENVYVTGSSAGEGSGSDYLTLKYDSKGQLRWSRRVNGAGNGDDHPTAMAVSPKGEVWVTGYSQGKDTGFDCVTVHYLADGTIGWTKDYNGPASGDDVGNAIRVDQTGNCYVCGYSRRSRHNSDYLLLAYDPDGVQKWVANYGLDRKQDARAVALALTSTGKICVTGFAEGNHADSDIVTADYSLDGKQLWVYRYDGPSHGQDKPTGIFANPANGSVVIGSSSGSGGAGLDYVIFSLSEEGKLQWQNRYNGAESGDDIPSAVWVGPDGSVFVTGYSQGSGSGSDIVTLSVDRAGKTLWTQRFNGVGNDVDRPIGIGQDASGSIYVAGYTWLGKTAGFSFVTLKYSREGSLLWIRELHSSKK